MDARQAFKQGVIAACIEQGHTTPQQIVGVIKTALVGDIKDAVGLLGDTAAIAIPAALAIPPLIGYGGGLAAGKATSDSELNVKDIQRQELINEYKRSTERLRKLKARAAEEPPARSGNLPWM